MGGARHFGEQPRSREVAVQLTLALKEASTCISHLSLILGIDGMLLCLYCRVATLHANPTCCQPELSILNHTPYAMNWSLHYTGRFIMHCSLEACLLHNSDHAGVTTVV